MEPGWSRAWLPAVALAAGAVTVGTMWLPWFRSGSAGRNSFSLFRAAQLLGIEVITPFRVVWFLVPVLLLVALACLAFGLTRAGSAIIAVLGAVLAGSGFLAIAALGAQLGSGAATAAGLCTIVLAIPGLLRTT